MANVCIVVRKKYIYVNVCITRLFLKRTMTYTIILVGYCDKFIYLKFIAVYVKRFYVEKVEYKGLKYK
jgi:hypothetical protein